MVPRYAFSLALIFFSLSLPAQTLPELLASKKTVGAHRGGGLSPKQNTIAQFQSALEAGADIIELDLRLTRDRIVVVFHDKRLSKLTTCFGSVAELSLKELRRCRFKNNAETIPTFDEVLSWANGRVIINAEFKDPAVIAGAIASMRRFDALEWTYFQTQERRGNYVTARRLDRDVNLIFLAKDLEAINWALEQNDRRLFALEIPPPLHRREVLEFVRSKGKLTSTYSFQTVPNRERDGVAACAPLFSLGFDMVMTDQTVSCVKQRQNTILILKE